MKRSSFVKLIKNNTYTIQIFFRTFSFFFEKKNECLQYDSRCNIDVIIRSYRIDWSLSPSLSLSLVCSYVCIRVLYFFLVVAVEWVPSNKNELMLLLQLHILIHGSCNANSKKKKRRKKKKKKKRKTERRKRKYSNLFNKRVVRAHAAGIAL